MHEMSIAEAILDLARKHVPPGSVLRSVTVRAGPMRGIDPSCLQWAWQALLTETRQTAVNLTLIQLPWHLHCKTCGRRWESPQMAFKCQCSSEDIEPLDGDDLQLVTIDVDDVPTPASVAN